MRGEGLERTRGSCTYVSRAGVDGRSATVSGAVSAEDVAGLLLCVRLVGCSIAYRCHLHMACPTPSRFGADHPDIQVPVSINWTEFSRDIHFSYGTVLSMIHWLTNVTFGRRKAIPETPTHLYVRVAISTEIAKIVAIEVPLSSQQQRVVVGSWRYVHMDAPQC